MPPRRITRSRYQQVGPYLRSSNKYVGVKVPQYIKYMNYDTAFKELNKAKKLLEAADKKYTPMRHIPLHIAKTVNAIYHKQLKLETHINELSALHHTDQRS